MILRDYQASAVAAAETCIRFGRSPCIVAPTGSGKTAIGVALALRLGLPTLWLVHRRELVNQAAERFRDEGVTVGVIMAENVIDTSACIQVASRDTLARRRHDWLTPRMMVIDEAHHIAGATYERLIAAYPTALRVGLTATPYRLDGRGLGTTFDELIVAATAAELCANGTLHEPRVFASSSVPDMRGVRARAGVYELAETERRCNTAALVGDIVRTWERHAVGSDRVALPTIVNAAGVLHAETLCGAFTDAGYRFAVVTGKTPLAIRAATLEALAAGGIDGVCQCEVLGEGFDCPRLACAVLARPTASLCLHVQQCGRIMRSCPDKLGAIILDHAGNTIAHGPVTRLLDFSLDDQDDIATRSPPCTIRRCAECGRICRVTETTCPECGSVKVAKPRLPKSDIKRELTAALTESEWSERKAFWAATEAVRMARGYAPGWSWFRYVNQYEAKPLVVEIDGRRELCRPWEVPESARRRHLNELRSAFVAKGKKPGAAAFVYKSIYGHMPKWGW